MYVFVHNWVRVATFFFVTDDSGMILDYTDN